jgi:hypothetical protein
MTDEQQKSLDEAAVTQYITETFADVAISEAMGYIFFFYGEDRKMPFVTIGLEDNDYDRASNLDRPGVYRLNIGVSKTTYRELFGPPPPAPDASGVVNTGHDFAVLNQLMPHPIYAPQSWVCTLNPTAETFETLKPLLAEAYQIAADRQARREARE